MEDNTRNLMLANYLDGKVTKQQLLEQFPDAEEDLQLMDLSVEALKSLQLLETNKEINIKLTAPVIQLKHKKYWYAAASVIIITTAVFFFFLSKKIDNISAHLKSNHTEKKLVTLARIMQPGKAAVNYQQQLLELAINDKNSTIRYLALEKLIQQPVYISELELANHVNEEPIFTNQTIWLELWKKIHPSSNSELIKWLNKENINPIVKDYGLGLLNTTVKL